MKRYISSVIILAMAFTFTLPFAMAEQSVEDAIVMYVGSSTALARGTQRYIDENNKEVMPVVENGRTLVPVRFVAESFDMQVSYDEKDALVGIENSEYKISFTIGSSVMKINGAEKPIDLDNPSVIAKVHNGRTLIPLRSMAEAIGKKVFYDRGLIIISDTENIYNPDTDKAELDKLIARVNVLPVVGTAEYMSKLIKNDESDVRYYLKGGSGGAVAVMEDSNVQSAAPTAATGNSKADYSETNVQVEGVDEADIVKTDGDYLYQVSGRKIIIAKINPVSDMKIVSSIEKADEEFYPNEIYIDGDKLTIIAQVNKPSDPIIFDSAKSASFAPRYRGYSYTQMTVYNISDRAKPVLERTVEVEGGYLSSRKIDNIVYLVTNKYFYYYDKADEIPIRYFDNSKEMKIGYDLVSYLPGFTSRNYLSITSIDITKPDKEAVVKTLLGGGENIYASRENLYIAASEYKDNTTATGVYKFSLNDGQITYLKKGEVQGNILNQFSMDEHNGYFRIATTSYRGQESNNLYILDDTMTLCGSIEGIAPSERIFSARFVGDRGYMVTFRQVDPLFVIDLADPKNPKILGNLKIPGYSDYIHPVDENHILGFGKDATEQGLYQGMKMALFDVSDVESPKQKFSELIGDRGTESALLQNHKALLYVPQKELLTFPVTVREVQENDQYKSAYGQLTFSGAYVYSFNAQDGFSLKGKISHLTKDDMLKLGNYVDAGKEISRIIYSSGSLFTMSNDKIQAHSSDNIEYQNGIDISAK